VSVEQERTGASKYVSIGGIEQWVQVNEGVPQRPLLLYLHGGPGGTSVPAAAVQLPVASSARDALSA